MLILGKVVARTSNRHAADRSLFEGVPGTIFGKVTPKAAENTSLGLHTDARGGI